jgi:hypothetical protein
MHVVGLGGHLGDRHVRVRGHEVLRDPVLGRGLLHPLGVQPQGGNGQRVR